MFVREEEGSRVKQVGERCRSHAEELGRKRCFEMRNIFAAQQRNSFRNDHTSSNMSLCSKFGLVSNHCVDRTIQ